MLSSSIMRFTYIIHYSGALFRLVRCLHTEYHTHLANSCFVNNVLYIYMELLYKNTRILSLPWRQHFATSMNSENTTFFQLCWTTSVIFCDLQLWWWPSFAKTATGGWVNPHCSVFLDTHLSNLSVFLQKVQGDKRKTDLTNLVYHYFATSKARAD